MCRRYFLAAHRWKIVAEIGGAMPFSGALWTVDSVYPTSDSIDSLEPQFRSNVKDFLAALTAAGASVEITATRRPRQRAYLMHYSWCIWSRWQSTSPAHVPPFMPRAGESTIEIQWLHKTLAGAPDLAASLAAAQEMVTGFEIGHLHVPPALNSNHIAGKALDMVISWDGDLSLKEKSGRSSAITYGAKDGTNPHVIAVGKSYGVYHYIDVMADQPHWSVNGY
jgi:hypothetical protein